MLPWVGGLLELSMNARWKIWFDFFVKWHINFRELFNAILVEEQLQFYPTHSYLQGSKYLSPEYLSESERKSVTGV